MEWISVKERMPPQPENIAEVHYYACAFECGKCELVAWAHTFSGHHEFIWNDDLASSITHWMPLPNHPEE